MKPRCLFYVSAFLLASGLAAWAADKQDTHLLRSKRSPGTVDRVESILEVTGTLKVVEGTTSDPQKATPLKLNAKATLVYAEKTAKITSPAEGGGRAVRHYDKAEALIAVGEGKFQPTLRPERRLIAVEVRSPKVVLFSPQGLLTRDELDLVDLLGNSLLVDQLLPAQPVAVGDTWKHSDNLLSALCGLDAVSSSDAQSVLQSIKDDAAQIEMAGHVAGSVNGLSTKMQLKAKYRFDIKANRITWFALLVKENREPGAIGPGLDVVARLQMKIVPGAKSAELTEASLKGLPLDPTASLERLSYASPEGGWQAAYDRRWVLISEKKALTVLRMADRGDYVAQCSISAMSPGDGKPLALSEFQDEIRTALGKNFRQFVKASQSVTEAEYQVCRVAAQGEVSGVPIQWIYYRIADKHGRHLVVLFTIEANMGERLQENDRELVRAIHFAPKATATAQNGAQKTAPPK